MSVLLVVLGIATAFAAGLWLGAWAVRRRRAGSEQAVPVSTDALPEDEAQARSQLEAALAARDGLERQARELRGLGISRLRLLESIAEVGVPALDALETELREVMGSPDRELDRRAVLGPPTRRIRELSVLLQDLMVLGQIEGGDDGRREEPVDLRELLETVARREPSFVLELDPVLPALIKTDRALLGIALEKLAVPARAAKGAVHLRASGMAVRLGLVEITLQLEGLPGLPDEVCTLLREQRSEQVLPLLPREGRTLLAVAIAVRALVRLGASIRFKKRQDGCLDLVIELVAATAPERRRATREPVAVPSVTSD